MTGKGRAHHGEILSEATKLAESGNLRPLIDRRRFTLDTALDAHAAVEAGTAIGKVIIDVAP